MLYRAGIVSRRPEGPNVFYSLADSSARAVLDEMLTSVKRQLRALSELATQPPDED
ncbi:MAG: helix-turn-helix domain-containing protein [Solirubrobacteraceae bacterium]